MARLGSLGGGDDGELSPSADINVTSLVDVAFVLLIIFMIAAPMMTGGVECSCRCPSASMKEAGDHGGPHGQVFADKDRCLAIPSD
jgi:biopolymer transport protein ExbD